MKLELLLNHFCVVQLDANSAIPSWLKSQSDFWSITKTKDELSIVCLEKEIPDNLKCEKGWRILKVNGPLDFGMTGVLSSLLSPLAESKISVFTISTFDTDYILIKSNVLPAAIKVLQQNNHSISD